MLSLLVLGGEPHPSFPSRSGSPGGLRAQTQDSLFWLPCGRGRASLEGLQMFPEWGLRLGQVTL
jgi:hypothetical protein